MLQRLFLLATSFVLGIFLTLGCDTTSSSENDVTPPVDTSTPANSVDLSEITSENFDELVIKSSQPILLDFRADWCSHCQELSPTIEKIASEYQGKLMVGTVNVDEQEQIAIKYNINSMPALLYFKDGEVVKRTLGQQSLQALKTQVDEVLGL